MTAILHLRDKLYDKVGSLFKVTLAFRMLGPTALKVLF